MYSNKKVVWNKIRFSVIVSEAALSYEKVWQLIIADIFTSFVLVCEYCPYPGKWLPLNPLILFQPQIVEKTPSSQTLSMTHEGCLFQDLRVPPGLLVSVYHYPYCVYPCTEQSMFVLRLWNSVPRLKVLLVDAHSRLSDTGYIYCILFFHTLVNSINFIQLSLSDVIWSLKKGVFMILYAKMLILNQVTSLRLEYTLKATLKLYKVINPYKCCTYVQLSPVLFTR